MGHEMLRFAYLNNFHGKQVMDLCSMKYGEAFDTIIFWKQVLINDLEMFLFMDVHEGYEP